MWQVGSPAIFDYGVNGPCFGADALRIPLGLAPQMARPTRPLSVARLPLGYGPPLPDSLPRAQGSSYAVVGSADLGASNAAGSRAARSRLGSHYARRADGGKTLFAASEGMDAQLTELRVYTSPGREGFYS